jgi:tetratricopeptide (TPR) repeat protein
MRALLPGGAAMIGMLLMAMPAQAQSTAQMTPGDHSHYNACLSLVKTDPQRAIASAQSWRVEGGGVPARECLALAQFAANDFDAALINFEAVAQASELARDGESVKLWALAADAAMMAERPTAALGYLDHALTPGDIAISPRAEASLRVTRAEALVDLKREKDAAAELDKATTLDPATPDGWLLKATLARRMGDAKTAETAILKAAEQAPDDAAVQYEAGNIAAEAGNLQLAHTAWNAAETADPESIPGKAAHAALARTGTAATPAPAETPAPASPPKPDARP